MIGKLKGLIDSYGEDYVILDVGGVGYQVHCSSRTLQSLPAPGEAAVLSIETYVREDQIKLFGFRSDVEREWFRLLQTVQGVGAKVALAVLGTLPPSDLANAIALASSAGGSVESTASATLAPTPCTVCSRRNHSRSMSLRKPNSLIWSSRTYVSIDSTAASPSAGNACSVREAQCT